MINEKIGEQLDRDGLKNLAAEGVYASGMFKEGAPGAAVLADGIYATLAAKAHALPAWALQAIDSCIAREQPENLFSTDKKPISRYDLTANPIEYLTDVMNGIEKGKFEPKNMQAAENYFRSRDPEAYVNSKLGVEELSPQKRAEIEKNKQKIAKEIAKNQSKEALKQEKEALKAQKKFEKEIQKRESKENKIIKRINNNEMKLSNLERKLEKKQETSELSLKDAAKLAATKIEVSKARDKVQSCLNYYLKDLTQRNVNKEFNDYHALIRYNQLKTCDFSVKAAFRPEDQKPSLGTKARASEVDRMNKVFHAETVERKKVPPENVGLEKKTTQNKVLPNKAPVSKDRKIGK